MAEPVESLSEAYENSLRSTAKTRRVGRIFLALGVGVASVNVLVGEPITSPFVYGTLVGTAAIAFATDRLAHWEERKIQDPLLEFYQEEFTKEDNQ